MIEILTYRTMVLKKLFRYQTESWNRHFFSLCNDSCFSSSIIWWIIKCFFVTHWFSYSLAFERLYSLLGSTPFGWRGMSEGHINTSPPRPHKNIEWLWLPFWIGIFSLLVQPKHILVFSVSKGKKGVRISRKGEWKNVD